MEITLLKWRPLPFMMNLLKLSPSILLQHLPKSTGSQTALVMPTGLSYLLKPMLRVRMKVLMLFLFKLDKTI